jgi:predicted TIM-barrel enzyme
MEIGEYEVLPVVEEIPVICGVHATDPRRRMWHWLGKVKGMGFSGVNNFPTHTIVDGHFRGVLEETGMSVEKEYEMIGLARRMEMFSIVYVGSPEEAKSGCDHRPRRHHGRRLHRREKRGGELGGYDQAHPGHHRRGEVR